MISDFTDIIVKHTCTGIVFENAKTPLGIIER